MSETELCKICGCATGFIFSEKILSGYEIRYYQCPSCKFIQTEDPYWLAESYQSAINVSDTGIVVRNEVLRKIVSSILFFYFNKNDKYIDYAGGYGIFTRMMRDLGYDFYWTDEYADNLLARGFEHEPGATYKAATAFEVFEHLVSPIAEIKKMFAYSDTVIFSTVLLPDHVPAKDWWYYGFNHGQHVGIYHYQTLKQIARQLDLNLYSDKKEYHILSKNKLSGIHIPFIKRLNKLGWYALVKATLKSKTNPDHHYLADKTRPHG